jgi:hypothetical protein
MRDSFEPGSNVTAIKAVQRAKQYSQRDSTHEGMQMDESATQ